jgi:mRNA interferase MazF
VLSALTCAPIVRTIRRIRSEVEVGPAQGLPETSVINCDSLITIPTAVLDDEPVGQLNLEGRIRLDGALRYSLGIEYQAGYLPTERSGERRACERARRRAGRTSKPRAA